MKTTLSLRHADKVTLHPVDFASAPSHFNPDGTYVCKEHGRVKLRPIHPDDEPRMVRFHEGLSEESVYLRYFEHISLDTRTLHERLARVCANTPDSFALVAEGRTGHEPLEILAVGRLTTTEIPRVASFALLMSDTAGKGLTREMLHRLIVIARAYGFHTLSGELLTGDHDTVNLCRTFGFTMYTANEEGVVHVNYPL